MLRVAKRLNFGKPFRRYMGGVGLPSSYFGIANTDYDTIIPNKPLIMMVIGGDASGKTTLINKLMTKFSSEHSINQISKAPNNPFHLKNTIANNKVVFIDVHEINNEMVEFMNTDNYKCIIVHPHVNMETYRKRVTSRLINDSLELRFGITKELFSNDILRHIRCSSELDRLKISINKFAELCILYDNNSANKEIIAICGKKENTIYNNELLAEILDKKKLDLNLETEKTYNFYREMSPYDCYGEMDYHRLKYLANSELDQELNTDPFFPYHLNDLFDTIAKDL